MNQDKQIDIEALMERIRQEASANASSDPVLKRYEAPAEIFHDGSDSPLLYAEELNYLNHQWGYIPENSFITSHRPGIGKVIVKGKRFFHRLVWGVGLSHFLEYLKNFNANLVRHLNHSARYVEARNAKLFWNLINKVDHDIESINERTDRLFDISLSESNNKIRQLEERIEELEKLISPERKAQNS